MMKKYEEPNMKVIRFEMVETVASNMDFTLSDMNNFDQDVEDW